MRAEGEAYLTNIVHLIPLFHHPVPDLHPETPFARRVLTKGHGGTDEHDTQRNAISEAGFLRASELIPMLPKVDWTSLYCGCRGERRISMLTRL
jgi:hypothetical protein